MQATETTAVRDVEILLVEDEPGDVELTRAAIADARALRLHVEMDGHAALDFLHRRNGREHAPRPDLVLLDLNLPGLDGRDLLIELKTNPAMVEIPVVVLSGSTAPNEIQRAYRRCANAYIVKPFEHDKLVAIIRAVSSFWIETARLPPRQKDSGAAS
ncbi:MAG TPA: response regulator [Planctomycetota bacterium]|nr:response regulator [Planctomycetota bacterium]